MSNRAAKPPRPDTTGILVIDKPAGRSSFSIVAEIRRRSGGAKTGHAGTLDPLATGVLVLALGKATRSIDQLMATEKRYETRIDLGAFTETDDPEGERQEVEVATPPSEQDVRRALEPFTGTFLQTPPAFSAVKVAGRRAYQIARAGETPEIKARAVTVRELELRRYEWPIVELSIVCAKGLYVRSLARDLGRALGTGGFCASIRRTAVGPFTLAEAMTLDELPEKIGQPDVIPLERALEMVG